MRHLDNRCGKCWAYLGKEDNYCRKCGTKRGDGEFNPEHNEMQTVYGPPPIGFKFVCNECELEWAENLMVNFNKYCPRCGAAELTVTQGKYAEFDDDEIQI